MLDDEASRAREVQRRRLTAERRIRSYWVLGLDPGVSLDELKRTYKDLVKVWHPDRFTDDPRLQSKAQDRLKEINEAYEWLLVEAASASGQIPSAAAPPPGEPSATGEDARRPTAPSSSPFWMPPIKPAKQVHRPYRVALGLGVLGLTAIVAYSLVFSKSAHLGGSTSLDSDSPQSSHKTGLRPSPGPADTFGLGATQASVLAVQGAPTSIEGNRWMYDLSWVSFTDGKVDSYSNISHNLHVQLYPLGDLTAIRERGYFTLGSTPDEVLAVEGTPSSLEGNRWRYESSWVDLDNGKVAGYSDGSRNLHVQLQPATSAAAARRRGYFTLGSIQDDVLAIQGTPTGVEGDRWRYDSSSVDFARGEVVGYSNASHNLHVEVYAQGDAASAAAQGAFSVGSSENEVLAVQGTPTSVGGDCWTYELSWIKFDNGRVESYANLSRNLKLRVSE